MRVSDAEREAAAAELREHFASGRLNQDELDERLTKAFGAKTHGDLTALFADLPSGGHGWASAGGPGDAGAPFGPGSAVPGWGSWPRPGASGGYDSGQGRGDAGRGPVGRGIGAFALTSVLIWVLFIVGILGVFGIGSRPLGVVLIIAAFALVRRLVFMIFGRRRMRGRGPRRRR
jgi:hypothetical protein